MSQALFTSITGMTTSQTKLDVIANNIANMNTTAFKSSNLTFSDLYSRTLSVGSSPSTSTGGINPMQVGLGVGFAGISTDFTNGSVQTTGNTNDLNIQGRGWFTVLNTDNTIGLTRDGSFSLDKNGNLVTQNGLKVLGTNAVYSSSASGENQPTVFVPNELNIVLSGKNLNTAEAGRLDNLNNADITVGKFSFDVYLDTYDHSRVNVDISSAKDLHDIANAINEQIIKTPALIDGTGAPIVTASVNTDGTFTIETKKGSVPEVTSIDFSQPGDTSNFLYETGLSISNFIDGKYSSKTLSYEVALGPRVNTPTTVSKASYAISDSGAVQATYSNGDTITVENSNGTMVLKYITSDGKIINNKDIHVHNDAISAANLQIQLASVLNEQGLLSLSQNIYSTGPNSGPLTFSIGNANGFGAIGSGGLEASNVNLAVELSNMIFAQRSIDANSRVFSSTSEILERLVNLQ